METSRALKPKSLFIVMVMLILVAAIIGLALYINLAHAQNREQAKIKAYSMLNHGRDQKKGFSNNWPRISRTTSLC